MPMRKPDKNDPMARPKVFRLRLKSRGAVSGSGMIPDTNSKRQAFEVGFEAFTNFSWLKSALVLLSLARTKADLPSLDTMTVNCLPLRGLKIASLTWKPVTSCN